MAKNSDRDAEGVGNQASITASDRPNAKKVSEFHTNSDLDQSANSQHHTLGTGQNQAAYGTHRHDGSDSVMLGEGIIISGSKGGNTALASILAAMVQILGVKDETT